MKILVYSLEFANLLEYSIRISDTRSLLARQKFQILELARVQKSLTRLSTRIYSQKYTANCLANFCCNWAIDYL